VLEDSRVGKTAYLYSSSLNGSPNASDAGAIAHALPLRLAPLPQLRAARSAAPYEVAAAASAEAAR